MYNIHYVCEIQPMNHQKPLLHPPPHTHTCYSLLYCHILKKNKKKTPPTIFEHILFHLPDKSDHIETICTDIIANGSLYLFSGESKLCSIQSFSHLGCSLTLSLHAGMRTLLNTIWYSWACFKSKLFFRDKMYNFASC